MSAWSRFVVLGALAGCGGPTIDAGTNDSGTVLPRGGASPSAGSERAASPPSSAAPTEIFRGYVEGYKFPSGSNTLVMRLAFDAGDVVTGTVYFGDGPTLPPATNPNVGYPPGFTYGQPLAREDLPLTVFQGLVSGSRVTLQVDTLEVYAKWCELQMTTYPWGHGAYGCEPNFPEARPNEDVTMCSALLPGADASIPIDCAKFYLCVDRHFCNCSATGCSLPLDTNTTPGIGSTVGFDLELVGDTLNGSVLGLYDSVTTYDVRMTRSSS